MPMVSFDFAQLDAATEILAEDLQTRTNWLVTAAENLDPANSATVTYLKSTASKVRMTQALLRKVKRAQEGHDN